MPTASITYQFGGFTRSLPGEDDGRSTLGFLNEPDLDRVLASTSYLVDDVTGELLESDIFFNSAFPWSVAATGERGRWDLETIALHEIGHFSGLGHSAIGETEMAGGGRRVLSTGAVMFPIALGAGDISGRTLRPDDIAGISDLYPDGDFNDDTGSVSGRVTKNGSGVFGAHVVAFDPRTGEMVGNFTLDTDGQFSIAGPPPGPARHPRRAARRCRHRQLLRSDRADRPEFQDGLLRSACHRAQRRRQRQRRDRGGGEVRGSARVALLSALCSSAPVAASAQQADNCPDRSLGRHPLDWPDCIR